MGKDDVHSINIQGEPNAFASDMKKLVNNKEFSDLRFIVGTQRKVIHAHRCVVMARCQVFKAMFADQQSKHGKQDVETPLILFDIQPDVFQVVLEYIYTNALSMAPRMAFDVIGAAIEYGLDDLQKSVVSYLQDNMTPQNSCEALRVAVTYGSQDLELRAIQYIEENAADVLHSDKNKSINELSESALELILRSDRLKMDEEELIKLVKDWANANSLVQGKQANLVAKKPVSNLRLTLLEPKELAKIEEENKKDHIIPAEKFSDAWKAHALKKTDEKTRAGTHHRSHHSEWIQSGIH